MATGDPVPAPQPPGRLSPLAYVGYYLLLFFAYWFGSNRFDADGDGDFDPEDVHIFLADMGVVARNFKKTKKPPKKGKKKGSKQGSTSQNNAQGSQKGNARPNTPDFNGPTLPQSGQGPESPQGDGGGGGLFDMDQNGDGEVNFADIMESQVEGESVSAYIRKQQRWPIFILSESLIAFGLWIVGAVMVNGWSGFVSAKAGIDSFSPGWSDLRLFGPLCEDWRTEVYRNITYQWTHIGVSHILMNCFMNLILGIPLEGLHGFFKMLLMYNVGVVGGALCFWIGDAHKSVVGMSGGCYALIGMHISDLIMNWKQLKFRKPIVVFLIILITVDVLSYVLALGSSNASHTAHIGGLIAGVLIGVLVGNNLVVKRHERVLQVVACFVAVALVGFCCAWMATKSPPQNILESDSYCWLRQIWNPTRFNTNEWVCVTCASKECVARNSNEAYMETVAFLACTTVVAG